MEADKNSNENRGASDDLLKAQERIAHLEKSKVELIDVQKELQAKLKAISDEEDLKKGNYEKIISENNSEIGKLNESVKENQGFKDKFIALENSIRKDLIELLPEEHRELANDLEIEKLKQYVKLNSVKTEQVDTGSIGRASIDTNGKSWDDFSFTELNKINETNPNAYKSLRRQKFKI